MDTFVDVGTQVTTIATELSASAGLWAGNFLVLIILTFALFFFAMRHHGGSGLVSLNLSLYGGYALYSVFPYKDAIIAAGATPFIQAFLSVIIFIAATVLPFVVTLRLTSQSYGSLSVIQNFLLSLLAATFLMALAYHVFNISNIYTFSDPLNELFKPEGYFFYWFIGPLIGIYFLAR